MFVLTNNQTMKPPIYILITISILCFVALYIMALIAISISKEYIKDGGKIFMGWEPNPKLYRGKTRKWYEFLFVNSLLFVVAIGLFLFECVLIGTITWEILSK
ncbi:hypothetical protein EBU94_04470 [bacterium]|nr:hypothetical protein [bacterium]